VELAAPLVAEQGLAEFSLDDVAAGADVTRNLLYHYFPRGRHDIIVAVAEYAGQRLTEGWIVDESIPLEERMSTNFLRLFERATEPTVAWRLTRLARSAGDPVIDEIVDRFHETLVASVAANQLGTSDPPPLVRIAIKAFVAFTESALDEARDAGIPPEPTLRLIAGALVAVVQAGIAAAQ
jgi:AcrR family transcriptional regulator